MSVSLSPNKRKLEKKVQQENGNQTEKANSQEQKEIQTHEKANSLVWDCGSSLYDSFELKSFERQLDSAIASRTLSMPHLSDPLVLPPPAPLPAPPAQPVSKKSSRFSRPFQKLLRSIFGPKQNSGSLFKLREGTKEGFYGLYDRSGGALSAIPEVPETGSDYGGLSPVIKPLMRRSASDRFTPTSNGQLLLHTETTRARRWDLSNI